MVEVVMMRDGRETRGEGISIHPPWGDVGGISKPTLPPHPATARNVRLCACLAFRLPPRLCDAAFLISLATPWLLSHTRGWGHQVTHIDRAHALDGLTSSAIKLAQRMIDPR